MASEPSPRGRGGVPREERGARVLWGRDQIIDGIMPVELDPMAWAEDANCLGVDPDLFFPERGSPSHAAKAVCAGCVVRSDCLEYAIAHDEKWGVWGGTTGRERGRIVRARVLIRRGGGS